jgi:thiamine biosynthesis lipoprotein
MRLTRDIMGMPVSVEIADERASAQDHEKIFEHFTAIDERFSTYKEGSEISRINRGEISPGNYSDEMKEIFEKAEETKRVTGGYFDIRKPDGSIDPSGLVKGWAVERAADLIRSLGYADFYVEAGGDIQVGGKPTSGGEWMLGIRNPFEPGWVKIVRPKGHGIATSGNYIRGNHIYDPHTGLSVESDVVSLTVIGPNVYEADRFATAAFALGERGIEFIERQARIEGYAIYRDRTAVATRGFDAYTV